jgi:hypothetical protein
VATHEAAAFSAFSRLACAFSVCGSREAYIHFFASERSRHVYPVIVSGSQFRPGIINPGSRGFCVVDFGILGVYGLVLVPSSSTLEGLAQSHYMTARPITITMSTSFTMILEESAFSTAINGLLTVSRGYNLTKVRKLTCCDRLDSRLRVKCYVIVYGNMKNTASTIPSRRRLLCENPGVLGIKCGCRGDGVECLSPV